ncbi:hypothetical protein CEUSTIGMA_g9950.t1 [Chlamydomonas eustigma]|uniref:EF-hand domain-containing protein n=1 Tax=Chlamydomonas eustigma TaxID=1157962 RepID=A0A250XHK8_9CHLO|nr:hypothetical protein CEUSTIGMA_g9950.t1 [Chlamydomonas eustigma]|eukprot:GAX82523.1 hypothetical protein CEUSTIGMA_g9950.t1 [Chlamydomonas eustigma]
MVYSVNHTLYSDEEFHRAFNDFDTNNDGFLTGEELTTGLKQLGICISREEVRSLIDQADKNGDDLIEFIDFKTLMMDVQGMEASVHDIHVSVVEDGGSVAINSVKGVLIQNAEAAAAELQVAFQNVDKDGDGYITADELRDTLHVILGRHLDHADARMFMVTADKDGDERINFSEFCSLMNGLEQKRQQEDKFNIVISHEDEMHEAFNLIDLDGDGFLSAEELEESLRLKGVKLARVQIDEMMIKAADVDGDGRLSFSEYMALMKGLDPLLDAHAEITDKEIALIFQKFDLNGDGKITAVELGHAMKSLGKPLNAEEVHELMGAADKDGDGHIDVDEFRVLIRGRSSSAEDEIGKLQRRPSWDHQSTVSAHALSSSATAAPEPSAAVAAPSATAISICLPASASASDSEVRSVILHTASPDASSARLLASASQDRLGISAPMPTSGSSQQASSSQPEVVPQQAPKPKQRFPGISEITPGSPPATPSMLQDTSWRNTLPVYPTAPAAAAVAPSPSSEVLNSSVNPTVLTQVQERSASEGTEVVNERSGSAAAPRVMQQSLKAESVPWWKQCMCS